MVLKNHKNGRMYMLITGHVIHACVVKAGCLGCKRVGQSEPFNFSVQGGHTYSEIHTCITYCIIPRGVVRVRNPLAVRFPDGRHQPRALTFPPPRNQICGSNCATSTQRHPLVTLKTGGTKLTCVTLLVGLYGSGPLLVELTGSAAVLTGQTPRRRCHTP